MCNLSFCVVRTIPLVAKRSIKLSGLVVGGTVTIIGAGARVRNPSGSTSGSGSASGSASASIRQNQ